MTVSVGIMQLTTLSLAIVQETSVTIMQAVRFYCNFAGGTFCHSDVGESVCYNYTVRSFCSTYAGDSFSSKYVGDNFYCNYTGGNRL